MSPAKPTSQSAAEVIRAPSKSRNGSTARSADPQWQVVSIGGRPKPPFDVVDSKLRVPPVRPGTVSRVALVNRLRTTTTTPVAIIAAPAGYGKTTLLAQWAARDPRPFGWVTLDERDDDPLVLLRHVAVAIDRLEPLSAVTFEALRVSGGSVWSAALPRLASAISSVDRRFVLVLDDADRVSSKESVEALALLVEQVGAGSMLVLSGRTPPPIGIARLRAGGELLEIGADALAMSRREAMLLLRATGGELTGDDAAELVTRTEGWPAGLYLGALAVQQNGHRGTGPAVAGDDRNLAEYLRAEHLDRLAERERAFLRRSAVLDRMSGPLCDAVLETTGSGARLESMARANMFVVPLDGTGRWYRYHGLLRDLLRRELEEQDPEVVAGLNRRAADWFENHGDPESALDPAAQAGDMARVARILAEIALPVYQHGRIADVERWLERFTDRGHLELYPELAVLGGWMHAARGRSADTRRWLDAAQRGASADTETGLRVAVLRSAMCGEGVGRMLYDAQSAVAGLEPGTQWRAMALALLGVAYKLAGDDDQAESILAEATAAGEAAGATDVAVLALGERALLAERNGEDAVADGLAAIGRSLVKDARLDGYATSAVALAVSARAMLRHGRWEQARSDLATAEEACESLTGALPWLAVQVRLEIARAHVALRDADSARAHLAAAVRILDHCPGLGVLPARAEQLRGEIEAIPEMGDATGSGLTGAELRLLPLLATHLSFREIGERLFVSRNTIKTQAISVYRKLGVTSRSGAIARAQELGLVDAAAPSASPAVTAGR
jgi:LuxR family maltose regulon positive regulatory protein